MCLVRAPSICSIAFAGHKGRDSALSQFMNSSVSRKSASTRHEKIMRTKNPIEKASRQTIACFTNSGRRRVGGATKLTGA